MSLILLAELVDRLRATDGAFIVESADSVTVSNLLVEATRTVLRHVETLGWTHTAQDSEGTSWGIDDLSEHFAPFRVTIDKPQRPDGTLVILTNSGFANFLRVGHTATEWRVARLGVDLHTRGRTFTSWDSTVGCTMGVATKSPRALVRETAAQRLVPADIRLWIAADLAYNFSDDASRVWADSCVIASLNAISDEIESNTGTLKFKGPPRLSLTFNQAPDGQFAELGLEAFRHLQEVVSWIYENEREAEVRHLLFSGEVARSGGGVDSAIARVKKDCSAAFDGAKIAYQMSISDLGKDTLKALSDLKKSVTEDTSKVADATRQTVAAVATALAVGLALLAARVASAAAPWLVFAVMVVVALYVGTIVYSGYAYIMLQRQLRVDWQPRLYRFLSDEDFKRMVTVPSLSAEQTFFRIAKVGVTAVILLTIIFALLWMFLDPATPVPPAGGTNPALPASTSPAASVLAPRASANAIIAAPFASARSASSTTANKMTAPALLDTKSAPQGAALPAVSRTANSAEGIKKP